jgi:biopolymer transport protein ExbD
VFFMVASELNDRTVEQLTLPRADQARPPGAVERRARAVAVNVLRDGQVRVRGLPVAAAGGLEQVLALEAAVAEREPPLPGQAGPAPSRLDVTIRADARARHGAVQRVLAACEEEGVYRTRVAAEPGAGR